VEKKGSDPKKNFIRGWNTSYNPAVVLAQLSNLIELQTDQTEARHTALPRKSRASSHLLGRYMDGCREQTRQAKEGATSKRSRTRVTDHKSEGGGMAEGRDKKDWRGDANEMGEDQRC